ncbi:MAG: ATPase [Gammaproteobacteria bacterium]
MPIHSTAGGRMRVMGRMAIAIVLLGALAPASQADVAASAPGGFVLKIETSVAAAPAEVYAQFIQIGQWWSDAHTYSGKAANMTLTATPGGCFCEALADGGFVRHAAVEYSVPGKALRLSGALGPLQEMGAYGLLSFRFEPDGAKTRLVTTYTVSGFMPGKGLAEVAAPVNGVLTEQVTRLKRLAETGKTGV